MEAHEPETDSHEELEEKKDVKVRDEDENREEDEGYKNENSEATERDDEAGRDEDTNRFEIQKIVEQFDPMHIQSTSAQEPMSPLQRRMTEDNASITSARRPPPDNDPPFDFHVFLENLRHKSADPIARYLKSFIAEFGKRPWTVREQTKIVHDYLDFITPRLPPLLSTPTPNNTLEGLEKLITTKLYSSLFSPAISQEVRKGTHQDDVERDHIFAQRVAVFGWVGLHELDVDVNDSDPIVSRFLGLAGNELGKINNYKAPRDKIICVLNCCKVIFGLLRHVGSDESADKFVPILIYVLLHSNPEYLVSNVQYISRFRASDKLNGEAGYYLSSLMGALGFIESIDRNALTCTDEEFESKVEASVAEIAERGTPPASPATSSLTSTVPFVPQVKKSSFGFVGRMFEHGAVGSAFGRVPSEERSKETEAVGTTVDPGPSLSRPSSAAARRETAEIAESERLARKEIEQAVISLAAMFPSLEKDVIEDVVRAKEGRVGAAVDACLDMIV